MEQRERFWNPYLAGIALGLVLLASLLVAGKGLGASGGVARFVVAFTEVLAPAHVAAHPLMGPTAASEGGPLSSWLVFMMLGMLLGGAGSSFLAGRQSLEVVRGPRISIAWRLALALSGGMMMGYAARLARGCTSGQALSGGALLSVGSWIFMLAVFAGGYSVALLVRRQWR
jgi:uncharacterized protein